MRKGVGGAWHFLVPATIFLAALLLFEVEPLIAKIILPWFGGSAAVWIACLLFFQATLLAGYLYAHLVVTRLSPLWQARVHIALLVGSLIFLPIIPSASWMPTGGENPLPLIIGLLAGTIGLPFLLLSSATPLLTAWRARDREPLQPRSLYRFYALSNLGSMIALLSYPVLIEPALPTRMQAMIWSCLYAGFVLFCGAGAWRYRRPLRSPSSDGETGREATPTLIDRIFWFVLPLAASALLLGMTNHILRNIAAIPLLWVLPLALYLLSFVICFDSPRWYYRPLWYALFAAMAGTMIYVMVGLFLAAHFGALLAFYAFGLFVCCMVCHGELAALKPAQRYLTNYYLMIAAGGACGGLFVAAIAPAVFDVDFDLNVILPVTVLIVIGAVWWDVRDRPKTTWTWLLLGAVLVAWVAITGKMVTSEIADFADAKFLERNFYGELRVMDWGPIRVLRNGNIVHGREFLARERASQPTSYYGPRSGLGLALAELSATGPIKVGVVGLGVGTIAAYGREGDAYRFYEINPAVRDIATTYFQYLAHCRAGWRIVIGDARLSLEHEKPQNFDLIAVDAFNSDSIPVHLLTREAFALYWRHLKPGGVLAVHVSNKYIDLAPVVALAARQDGKTARRITDPGQNENAVDQSTWVLVSADPAVFTRPALKNAQPVAIPASLKLWTDDYSNIWRSLR